MAKIAIDIVILPPEEIMDRAIELNNQFPDDPIQLNKQGCLPHISLCMGVAKEEDLEKMMEIQKEVISNFSKLSLTITEIKDNGTSFDIASNENLQKLHETLITKLEPYLSYDSAPDMFYSSPVAETTIGWVNKYRKDWSFEKYYPHLTLGKTKRQREEMNITFTASKIGLFHLGSYNTCSKLLASFELA